MVTTFTDVVFYVLYLCLLIGISDEVGGARPFLQTDNVKQFLPVWLLIKPHYLRAIFSLAFRLDGISIVSQSGDRFENFYQLT